jgi:hypothetical protein
MERSLISKPWVCPQSRVQTFGNEMACLWLYRLRTTSTLCLKITPHISLTYTRPEHFSQYPNGAKTQLLIHSNTNRLLDLCTLWPLLNRGDQLISQKRWRFLILYWSSLREQDLGICNVGCTNRISVGINDRIDWRSKYNKWGHSLWLYRSE